MRSQLKKQSVSSITPPLDMVDLMDEIGMIDSLFECAFLAVGQGCCDRTATSAIQSVMLVAQDRLAAVLAQVETERERQRLLEEAAAPEGTELEEAQGGVSSALTGISVLLPKSQ